MATLQFPSPSSGFVPSQDGDTFRGVLESRMKLASSSSSRSGNSKASGSSSSSRRQSFAVALDEEDKENSANTTPSGPLSRTASASSIKGKQAQSQQQARRRSSAAHPLTPSSSASRSRPNSVIANGSSSTSSSRSNSAINISSYVSGDAANAASGSRNVSSNARNSLDCTPALAGLALYDSALEVEDDNPAMQAVSTPTTSPTKEPSRHRSGSGDKARSGKRRSRMPTTTGESGSSTSASLPSADSEDSDDGAGRPLSSSASVRSGNRRLSSSRSTSTLTPSKKRANHITSWEDADVDEDQRMLGDQEEDLEASLSALPTPSGSPNPVAIPIVIRDYAFPSSDPRYKGELADPDPISIPAMPSYNNHYQQAWYDSPNPGGFSITNAGDASTSILSSSSSSSLSSSFTPPPFGSFGFGHAYHVNNNQQQSDTEFSTSPQTMPPPANGKYSWNFVTDNTPRSSGTGGAGASTAGTSGAGGDNDSAFTTSSADTAMPHLLGSELSIEEFDDEDFMDHDDEEEEYEERTRTYNHQSIPEGGLLYRAVYPFTAEAEQEMSLNEGGELHCFSLVA